MSNGRLIYHALAEKNFDPFTGSGNPATQQFIRNNISSLRSFAPFFTPFLAWMPEAFAYRDAYAVYAAPTEVPSLASQPQFIARDVNGNMLFIPWGSIPFPQYAGDISNPAFREFMIESMKGTLYGTGGHYAGLWVDDVNLEPRTCDATGKPVMPVDPATGQAMTAEAWARYFAEYMALLRAALPPATKIMHNAVWTATHGTAVDRQISSCDWVYLERGFSDAGLTGGTGPYSLQAFMAFIDHVHALGTAVCIGEYYTANRDYAVAGYFLIHAGSDMIGFTDQVPDATWPTLLRADLGHALGMRSYAAGLWSRQFSGGAVYMNEPGAGTVTVPLRAPMVDFAGNRYAEVTLAAQSGMVLLDAGNGL